jgi:protein gp37
MLKVLSQTDEFPVLKNVWLGVSVEDHTTVDRLDLLRRVPASVRFVSLEPLLGPTPDIDLSEIDWAIVGGESGPRSRAIEKVWIEEIFDACRHHGTAFFFKQWGGVNKKKTGRIFNGQEWNEYPIIT